jgi:hypothetical protein
MMQKKRRLLREKGKQIKTRLMLRTRLIQTRERCRMPETGSIAFQKNQSSSKEFRVRLIQTRPS